MRGLNRALRQLTRRQLVSLLAVAGLALTTAAAAVVGRVALATALVGVLGMLTFVAAVQLRRRLWTVIGAIQLEIRHSKQAIIKEIQEQAGQRTLTAEQHDAAHRRVLAAVETERLAASDRQQELLAKFDQTIRDFGRTQRSAVRRQQEQTREIEALLQLYRGFRPRAPMPPAGGWALNAPGLLRLLSLVEQHQPKLVLELGSGTSSVWIGYALEQAGGRLVSVDHASEFAEQTRTMLAWHGLGQVAEVRHAPLRPCTVSGRDFSWYAAEAFADLGEVGLLVVDGPPGATGPIARFPALHVLEPRLSASATIFLDDADRPDERDVLRQWIGTFPGLVRDPVSVDRHAVLTYARC